MAITTKKPLTIHIGKMGGVRVDADEFFAQPEVQKQQEILRRMDLAGKKLVGDKLIPMNRKPRKASSDS